MLSLHRNRALTKISKDAIHLREMELEWLSNNLSMIAKRSMIIAGFHFTQFSTTVKDTSFLFDLLYVHFAVASMGILLLVVIVSTYVTAWGKGLALRGPEGFDSMLRALRIMRKQQGRIIPLFLIGLVFFTATSLMLCLAHNTRSEGVIACLFLCALGVYFVYWALQLRRQFRYSKGIDSGIPFVEETYGGVQDIDQTVQFEREQQQLYQGR